MRIATLALAATLTACLASPLTGRETDEPGPARILMVGSFICPGPAIQEIGRFYESTLKPVEEEVVAEGALVSTGLYFHTWGDEWNVHYYRIGYDLGDMLDGITTVNQRVQERNPELQGEPGPFAVCTAHKDNIYGLGPGTGRPDVFTEDAGGN